MNLREFLFSAAAASSTAGAGASHRAAAAPSLDSPLGLAEIGTALAEGRVTSHRLTQTYLVTKDGLDRRRILPKSPLVEAVRFECQDRPES